MSRPTDLSPEESAYAAGRLRELADRLVAKGVLRTPEWRGAFLRTWRHPYVPSFYPELDTPCLVCLDPRRRREWLEAVYSDQTLITKVTWVPYTRSLRPGAYPMFSSSSTLPSLVLSMLEALEVTDGFRVLEIGTGTGYNAALLCERLGGAQVTSVDIDPELVDLAAERLSANDYTPTLAALDGAHGYPEGAPYDRIIATCAVPFVPTEWLTQVTPGGMLMVDVRGKLGGGIVRLTADGHGSATGHFVPGYGSFMPLRHTLDHEQPGPARETDDEPVESVSQVDPAELRYGSEFGFVVQWHLPDVTWSPTTENGQPGVHLRTPDGSWASACATRGHGGFTVAQAGQGRLWDRVEEAYEFWHSTERPNHERFGLTATTSAQYIWFDHRDGEHRWPLPTQPVERLSR